MIEIPEKECFQNIFQLVDFHKEFLHFFEMNEKDKDKSLTLSYNMKDYESIDMDLDYDECHYSHICDEFERLLLLYLKDLLRLEECLEAKINKYAVEKRIGESTSKLILNKTLRKIKPTKIEVIDCYHQDL